MKKIIIAALAVLCLCGCSDNAANESSAPVSEPASQTVSTASESAEAASLKDVYAEIESAVELPEMITLDSDALIERYYGITADMMQDYAGGVDSSGVGQDEIVLIKAKDESQVSAIETALQTRYDSKLAQNENYNPEEAEKIRKCKVETNGLYVTMIISDDAAAITEIVNNNI